MIDTRKVQIFLSQEDMTEIAEKVGSWDKVFTAIGYLSTWNYSYPEVRIYRDGATDLHAVYVDNEGNRQYNIGAIWHDDHYGYHS
jgi:hypothetical protein